MKRVSIAIFSLILILTMPVSIFASNFVIEDIVKSTTIDDASSFRIQDNQSFTLPYDAVITGVRLIAKTEVAGLDSMQIIIRDDINGTPATALTQRNNEIPLKTYFRDITFNMSLGVSRGTYWLDLGGSSYHRFYADYSPIDTYTGGGVNSLDSTNDLYFIIEGYYTNTSVANEVIKTTPNDSIRNQIFGVDQRIHFFAGILIILALMVFVAQYIKLGWAVLVTGAIVSVAVYLLGLMSFYYVGLIVINNIVSMFAFGGDTNA